MAKPFKKFNFTALKEHLNIKKLKMDVYVRNIATSFKLTENCDFPNGKPNFDINLFLILKQI